MYRIRHTTKDMEYSHILVDRQAWSYVRYVMYVVYDCFETDRSERTSLFKLFPTTKFVLQRFRHSNEMIEMFSVSDDTRDPIVLVIMDMLVSI